MKVTINYEKKLFSPAMAISNVTLACFITITFAKYFTFSLLNKDVIIKKTEYSKSTVET